MKTHGPYAIRHGDVWWTGSSPADARHVCGPHDMLAVALDLEDGVLHKHGAEKGVVAWAERTRKTLAEGGAEDMASAIAVVSFLPLPEALDELNLCIATTGRAARFVERLAEIAEANPGAAPPPWAKYGI